MTRLERLERIVEWLKPGEHIIVADLAENLGVSMRTLSRDIDILRDRGVPIESDRGRGGGIRLHWSWGVGQVNLNFGEAVDLLVSLAVAKQMRSPLMMANLDAVRRKLVASFAPSMRRGIDSLGKRILIGETASPFVQSSYQMSDKNTVATMHQAFAMKKAMTMSYCAESGVVTERTIEPHYLLLNYPVWYVLAWDRLRTDVRTFRCDRMKRASIGDAVFTVQPITRFESALEGVATIRM